MAKFWDLFEKSTITTFVITIGILGTCCYLWGTSQAVPEILGAAMWSVLGYFMGMKGQLEIVKQYKAKSASS